MGRWKKVGLIKYPLQEKWVAWAGALYSGEGSTGVYPLYCGNKSRMILRARLCMADKGGVVKFHWAVGGLGILRGPYLKNNNTDYKEQYEYCINEHEGVQYLIAILWPYLIEEKRAQATECFEIYYNFWRNK